MAQQRVAVVTGANRGLGLGTSRALAKQGYRVGMVGRNRENLEAAAASLKAEGLAVEPFVADVTRQEDVDALAHWVEETLGRADVLVNNAGVLLGSKDFFHGAPASVFLADPDLVRQNIEVNTLGPLRLCQALVPLMRRHRYGRIVNISSGMGQLSDMGGYWVGYRMSKTALNVLTRVLAAELDGTPIKVNSICPGWVKTDMGGPQADRTVEEAVPGIVWAATLPADGPSGGFFRDGEPIPW
jgi:Short-chain dehydrogenases of various substrate specificities